MANESRQRTRHGQFDEGARALTVVSRIVPAVHIVRRHILSRPLRPSRQRLASGQRIRERREQLGGSEVFDRKGQHADLGKPSRTAVGFDKLFDQRLQNGHDPPRVAALRKRVNEIVDRSRLPSVVAESAEVKALPSIGRPNRLDDVAEMRVVADQHQRDGGGQALRLDIRRRVRLPEQRPGGGGPPADLLDARETVDENSMSTASGFRATTCVRTFASPKAAFLPDWPALTTVACPGQRAARAERRSSTQ